MRCTVPVPSPSDLATHTLDSAPPPRSRLTTIGSGSAALFFSSD